MKEFTFTSERDCDIACFVENEVGRQLDSLNELTVERANFIKQLIAQSFFEATLHHPPSDYLNREE